MAADAVETASSRGAVAGAAAPEVTFVFPCLDEEATIATVVRKARAQLEEIGVAYEILVVDNGSEDDSVQLAEEAGATVVHEQRRGYGSAYLAGFAAARGQFIVMADADDTYDLGRVDEFVERMRAGDDMVIGSRFRGEIRPGAMPWSHRYIGNPILTGMLNLLFRTGVSDAHCGLRAVRKDALPKIGLSSTGMEFASEMVIKAGKRRLRVSEIPIVYHPRIGESKLNGFRDAWRHVRFMLVHSASFLFLLPGGVAALAGFVALCALATFAGQGEKATAGAIVASTLTLVGAQVVALGLFARTYAVVYLGESEPRLERLWTRMRLEHGLLISACVLLVGAALAIYAYVDGAAQPQVALLALTLIALGAQGLFASFFLSILGLSDDALVRVPRRR